MPHKAEGTNTHGRPPLHCFWSEEDVKISWWPTVKAGVRSHDSSSARAPVIGQHAPRWIIQSAARHKLLPLTAMAITAPRFFLLGEINRRPFRSMLLDQLVSIVY